MSACLIPRGSVVSKTNKNNNTQQIYTQKNTEFREKQDINWEWGCIQLRKVPQILKGVAEYGDIIEIDGQTRGGGVFFVLENDNVMMHEDKHMAGYPAEKETTKVFF